MALSWYANHGELLQLLLCISIVTAEYEHTQYENSLIYFCYISLPYTQCHVQFWKYQWVKS